jgi:hypothetical protein
MKEEGYDEQQQQGGGNPYYQPVIMASEKADLYDKIKPEEVVEDIKYRLMGYEFNKSTGDWIINPVYKELAITRLGAWQITSLLFPVSNKSVPISKLKDDDIRKRTRMLVRTAMKMCLRNWQEYGIRSPEQLYFVKEIVLSVAFITLKLPEDAGARTFIQGVTNEQKIIQESPNQRGAVSAIFRR